MEKIAPPPVLKLWFLTARDMRQPPFNNVGVAHTVFVAAPDEEAARALAFVEVAMDVWGDPAKTLCVEFLPRIPGVVTAICG